MQWLSYLCLMVVAFTSTAIAQSRRSSVAVEGDVYLVMQSGDTKKGAGRTVYAIPSSDSLRAVLQSACTTHRTANGQLADSLLAAMRRQNDALRRQAENLSASEPRLAERLAAQAVDSLSRALKVEPQAAVDFLIERVGKLRVAEANSGMNAHFRFSSLAPGPYVLASTWRIGDTSYL